MADSTIDIEKLANLNILELFGMQDAPEEEQKKMTESITQLLLEQVLVKIRAKLSEEKKEEFMTLFSDGETNEERAAFLKTNIPDFEEMIMNEALAFKYAMQKVATEHSESTT